MGEVINITAEVRDRAGKGVARAVRVWGIIEGDTRIKLRDSFT